MSEQQLRTMMDASAARVPVGPAPVAGIERLARRRRARRRSLASVAAAVMLGTSGAVAGLISGPDERSAPDPAPAPSQTVEGVPLSLPTSQWREGDRALLARIEGVLHVDDRGCVYLGSTDPRVPSRDLAVWPAGYSAYVVDGQMVLYDAEGRAVAREGDRVRMSGGWLPSTSGRGDCGATVGTETPYVQSTVEVTGHPEPKRVSIALPTTATAPLDIENGATKFDGGMLVVTADGCIGLRSPISGEVIVPIWPEGYSAVVENDRLTLYGPDGDAYADDREYFNAVGYNDEVPSGSDSPCLPRSGKVYFVQSQMHVTF
jgi:hypothetical protein